MSASRRRRIAVGVAIVLGVAFVLARRERQPASAPPAEQPKPEPVSDWLAAPAPSPPPVPPRPQPRPAPVTVLPPPVVAPAAAVRPPRRRRLGRRSSLVAGVVLVVGALLGASFALKSNSSRLDSFEGTLATTTAPTTTTSTTPTTTAGSGSGSGTSGTPLCVKLPKGWKSAWLPSPAAADPPALALTNFRFGKSSLEWGLLDPHVHWARGDVMVVVADWTKAASTAFRSAFFPSALRVRRTDVARYGTFPVKIGHRLIKTDGRLLEVWVEARPPTASTLAAANRVLAGVGVCAANS
jgi:hypothetical protein